MRDIVQQTLLGFDLALQFLGHAVETPAQIIQLITSFAHAFADPFPQVAIADCLKGLFQAADRARHIGSQAGGGSEAERGSHENVPGRWPWEAIRVMRAMAVWRR